MCKHARGALTGNVGSDLVAGLYQSPQSKSHRRFAELAQLIGADGRPALGHGSFAAVRCVLWHEGLCTSRTGSEDGTKCSASSTDSKDNSKAAVHVAHCLSLLPAAMHGACHRGNA